jgi:hypothetical protein
MRTTPTRTRTIAAAIAGMAVPILLFLGAGTSLAEGFNPQPDPPSISQQGAEVGIGNPNDRRALGGPDTKFNPPPGLDPNDLSRSAAQSTGGAK